MKQVTSIKFNLLQKLQKYNTQTLQLFTEIIEMDRIYKNN
jgi:hypothetical protein